MAYDHRAIEQRWQAYWEREKTFKAELDRERPKFYVLDMFPYPSGDGLHVGHAEGYTATDIIARYKRMRGFNVLHPMGWDAFGLPAERFAMKTGTHPAVQMARCADNFRRQLKSLGFSYDWSREINTTDPAYYKWTQWIFLQVWGSYYDPVARRARPIEELPIPAEMHAQGEEVVASYRDAHRLAYLENAPVNWCAELRVVLANEEVAEYVEQGYEVVRKPMKQWKLRITAYAERLLEDLEGLDWPANVAEMQHNWIGRSEGATIAFPVQGASGATIEVFTTRPDTLFGATYLVLAPEHPLVAKISAPQAQKAVAAYVDETAHKTERERQVESAQGLKTGVATGAYARHPASGAAIPIWIADYVLMGYGTGAIMAVPAHDARDHAFARQHGLPIVEVVRPPDHAVDVQEHAFEGTGVAVNSDFLDGLDTEAAKRRMISELESRSMGRREVSYKLRDWLFSRQRYWGEPFPLVYGSDGRVHPVPEDELPVTLPEMPDFNPSETGEPPLAKAEQWRRLPHGVVREVNTMPQWAGSCWYYLRYCDPDNDRQLVSPEAERYWMPVDLYVGGVEHAVLHLLYARFWHKLLYDLGHVSTPEPFQRLINPGIILGATFVPKDRRRDGTGKAVSFLVPDVREQPGPGGEPQWVVRATGESVDIQWDRMSKSRGNVVNPDEVVEEFGADTLRLYEMFIGPLEHSAPWQPEGVSGLRRFLTRVHRLYFREAPDGRDQLRSLVPGEGDDRQRRLLHRTIYDVTDRLDRMAFNTAISALMVFVRDVLKDPASDEPLGRDAAVQFCLLLAPFAPHLAEEIWASLGFTKTLAYEPWPAAEESLLEEDTISVVLQVNGKRRGEIRVPADADQATVERIARQDPDLQRHLDGREPRRVVVVPRRLVNFVV